MTRKTIRSLSLVAAGALVGTLTYLPVRAEAKHSRVHASGCMPANSNTSYSTLMWGSLNSQGPGNGQVQASGSAFICPINDDYLFSKGQIDTLNVHGWESDTSNPARAMACRTSWWGGYGYCGAWDQTSYSGTGSFALSPSLTRWASSFYADFGYIFVSLPPGGGALSGYYIAD